MAPERQREDSSVPWRIVKALARAGLLSLALLSHDALPSSTPIGDEAHAGEGMEESGNEQCDFSDLPDHASLFNRTIVLTDEEGELRMRLTRTSTGEILVHVGDQSFAVADTIWGTPATRLVDGVTKESSTTIALRSSAVPEGRILVETGEITRTLRSLFMGTREMRVNYATTGNIPGPLRVLQGVTGSAAKIEFGQVAPERYAISEEDQ